MEPKNGPQGGPARLAPRAWLAGATIIAVAGALLGVALARIGDGAIGSALFFGLLSAALLLAASAPRHGAGA